MKEALPHFSLCQADAMEISFNDLRELRQSKWRSPDSDLTPQSPASDVTLPAWPCGPQPASQAPAHTTKAALTTAPCDNTASPTRSPSGRARHLARLSAFHGVSGMFRKAHGLWSRRPAGKSWQRHFGHDSKSASRSLQGDPNILRRGW